VRWEGKERVEAIVQNLEGGPLTKELKNNHSQGHRTEREVMSQNKKHTPKTKTHLVSVSSEGQHLPIEVGPGKPEKKFACLSAFNLSGGHACRSKAVPGSLGREADCRNALRGGGKGLFDKNRNKRMRKSQ